MAGTSLTARFNPFNAASRNRREAALLKEPRHDNHCQPFSFDGFP